MAPHGLTEADGANFLLGQLLDCPELSQADRIVVGFSGGLDSTVLLHLLVAAQTQGLLKGEIVALHVHHGLQLLADSWVDECRHRAAGLGISLISRLVTVAMDTGASPEAAAREARYAAFSEEMRPGTVLVLAHHADDQVETVLLNLLRGSGPRGLAGMPMQRRIGVGQLSRPLLGVSRALIQQYAEAQGLAWIDDPSNCDTRFTRNFLRHDIIRVLQQQVPGFLPGVLRSSRLQAEAEDLLVELAAADLEVARGGQRNQLQLSLLTQWSPARVRNLLRFWMRGLQDELNGCDVTHQALQHCVEQLIPAQDDAAPVIAWGAAARRLELRRHRGCLYLVKPLPPLPQVLHWDPAQVLQLPGILGSLRCITAEGEAPDAGSWPGLEVRFRVGGERLQLPGRPTRALKQLLQESGMPPWLRPGVPLIYCGSVLLAAGDMFVHAAWPAQVPEKTVTFVWERMQLHCGY